MHPLSAKTTTAPIDLDVLVMLKPQTEARMAAMNKGGGERGEQIT